MEFELATSFYKQRIQQIFNTEPYFMLIMGVFSINTSYERSEEINAGEGDKGDMQV